MLTVLSLFVIVFGVSFTAWIGLYFNMSIPLQPDPDRILFEVLLARLTSWLVISLVSSAVLAVAAVFLSAPSELEWSVNAVYGALAIVPTALLVDVLIHIRRLIPYRNTRPFSSIINNLGATNCEKLLLSKVYDAYLQSPEEDKEWMARTLVRMMLSTDYRHT